MKKQTKKDAGLLQSHKRRSVDPGRKAAPRKNVRELKEQLAAMVEYSDDAIIGKDLKGIVTFWNKGAENIYGYTAEEMTGRPISLLVPPGQLDEIPKILKKIMHGESVEHYETIRVTKGGKQVYVLLKVSPIKNSKGEIIGASTIARDITEHRRAQERIRFAEEEWEQTFDALPDMVAVIDNQHIIRRANKALSARLGVDRERLIGKLCYKSICSRGEPLSNCPGSLAIVEGKEHMEERFEKELKGYYLISCTPISAGDGTLTRFVEVWRDISERKRMEERLQEAAITDSLTGLFNRRGFLTLAEQQLNVAARNRKNMVLLFLDLNDMKEINDKFGHKEGDRALIDTANLLEKTFRASDIIARIGGDEFAVLLTEPSERNIEPIIFNHIQRNLKSYNEKGDRAYQLSFSMGIAYYDPEQPCDIGDLLTKADANMYVEKKRRKSH